MRMTAGKCHAWKLCGCGACSREFLCGYWHGFESPFPAAVAEILERFICAVATGATHESVLHVDAPVEDIIEIRTYVCACMYARMRVCMYASSPTNEFSLRHNTRSQTKCIPTRHPPPSSFAHPSTHSPECIKARVGRAWKKPWSVDKSPALLYRSTPVMRN